MRRGSDLTPGRRALHGLVYVVVLTVGVLALLLQAGGTFRSDVEVTTTLDSVGDGLPVGSDVKMRGVIVGRVAQVDAGLVRSRVVLDIEPAFAQGVPASAVTRILPANLFGAPYLDLRVAGSETPTITSGALLAQDRSQATVQLQSVFHRVYDVLAAIQPAKLDVVLSAIADALRGNGARIGEMIRDADSYLSALNPHAALFVHDLHQLAGTLAGLRAAAPDLLAAARDASATARLLVANRDGLRQLLGAGTRAIAGAGAFLDADGSRLVRIFGSGASFARVLAPLAPSIEPSLISFKKVAGSLISIMAGPQGAHVVAYIASGLPARYTSADCPRYGSLAGPNCSRRPGRTEPTYGGSVGPVGSTEEQHQLGGLLAPRDRAAAGALGSLLLGPALRGSTVISR